METASSASPTALSRTYTPIRQATHPRLRRTTSLTCVSKARIAPSHHVLCAVSSSKRSKRVRFVRSVRYNESPLTHRTRGRIFYLPALFLCSCFSVSPFSSVIFDLLPAFSFLLSSRCSLFLSPLSLLFSHLFLAFLRSLSSFLS